ncbi:hypothetical protein PR001_g4679 [Phytophthora rubi]|uniref:Uncharacterized protein n=1 Tax=Phytophthora rubi TaxID=129364 RepID=A0A6A3NYL0_9STRA|nr:hypothetical protein PR001_g4679 [Phytophthora rubi]
MNFIFAESCQNPESDAAFHFRTSAALPRPFRRSVCSEDDQRKREEQGEREEQGQQEQQGQQKQR